MELLLPLLISTLITALSVPPAIIIAKRFKLLDDPKLRPHPAHIHQKIIPRAGGLAIYLGVLVSSLLLLSPDKHLIGILLAITLLLLIGLIDDRLINFHPYPRLIMLFLAAGIVVSSGIGISFITNPLANTFNLPQFLRLDQFIIPINIFGPHRIIIIADIFAFLWIVSLTQIINWSKGVDGQMPGITLITALVLGLSSYRFYLQGDINQLQIAKLSFIVAGSSLGFLIFNWHPAKILPGFSGSTILAFILATLAILSGAKVATALLVLAVPSVDFIYTIFRRIASGKSPIWGDRGHFHHRLLDLGWTPWQISLFYILGSAILGLIALSVNTQSKLFAVVVVAVIFISFILWLNSFGTFSKPPGPDNGSKI